MLTTLALSLTLGLHAGAAQAAQEDKEQRCTVALEVLAKRCAAPQTTPTATGTTAAAGQQPDADFQNLCLTLAALGARVQKDPCDALTRLVDGWLSARDQPHRTSPETARTEPDQVTNSEAAGPYGQAEAAATIRPINLAGGALSISGAKDGARLVANLTLNPWAIAAKTDPLAQRFGDVTVSVPLEIAGGDGLHAVQFASIRARVNAVAFHSAAAVEAALADYDRASGRVSRLVQDALETAPDPTKCLDEILTEDRMTAAGCGKDVSRLDADQALALAVQAMDRELRDADRWYAGLDLRADVGDPSNTVTGDDGLRVLAAGAAGVRLDLASSDLELRARFGASYVHLNSPAAGVSASTTAGDYALGVVLRSVLPGVAQDRLELGVGVEGQFQRDAKDVVAGIARGNHLDLTATVSLPTTDGRKVAIGIRTPLNEDTDAMGRSVHPGTQLTISGDFGLLSPGK